MKLGAIAIAAAALSLAGCGGSNGQDDATRASTATGTTTITAGGKTITGKLPAGAVGPVDTAEEAVEGPAATEASPEAKANGPQATGQLEGGDRSAATATVRDYLAALDRRNAARVCALVAPGGIDLGDLPRQRGGCRASVGASIGTRPPSGGPAWRHTELVEVKPEALGDERARITATVTHHFSDRKYVSVEDDVIYLERIGGRVAARQAERDLLPRGRLRAAPAAGLRPSPGLVARSGGSRHRAGHARAGAWGACGRRR